MGLISLLIDEDFGIPMGSLFIFIGVIFLWISFFFEVFIIGALLLLTIGLLFIMIPILNMVLDDAKSFFTDIKIVIKQHMGD